MMGSMRTYKAGKLSADTTCDVRTDPLTRMLFATDASIYQIEPFAVAFPKSPEEATKVIQNAASEGVAVTPRGAGTGLAGGAIGNGVVIDYAKHNKKISDFNLEQRTVTVEAGVVLDQLNNFLQPHGLRFGPDVATSSRATLGGMINNNSSGSHVPLYGTTIDHVRSLDIIMSDATRHTIGRRNESLKDLNKQIGSLILRNVDHVNRMMPAGLPKRWAGYGFDRWLRDSRDLTKMIGGSEGTLAVVTGAELNLVPLPKEKGLGVIFFNSVAEAMQATVELLHLNPTAIEHIDNVLFDQTMGQLQFKQARALLELDEAPCKSLLLVEFFDHVDEKLNALEQLSIGIRRSMFKNEIEMNHIWNMRKAGLSLLTGCKGDAKPTAGIEDVCVRPEVLPQYVEGLQSLMEPLGLKGSYYGHAASGLLHVRPVVDLHKSEDIKKFRKLAEGVSALTKQFKGSLAGEHGVGIARTEFMEAQLGPDLMALNREVKKLFDTKNIMNPGKIISEGKGYQIDRNLRQGAANFIRMPFEPKLAFASKDGSLIGNLEQCNGCGGCRKSGPTMCPTFQVTGEEIMSTRGRANTIRHAMQHRHHGVKDHIFSREMDLALSNCLSCKACTTECPSNVNLALIKAELIHERRKKLGSTPRERLFSHVDQLARYAAIFPRLTNRLMNTGMVKSILDSRFGITSKRQYPAYTTQQFSKWFQQRKPSRSTDRGSVLLWNDCFCNYNEPHIGQAAVTVLERAGFRVVLPEGQACCGRSAFSNGDLDTAKSHAAANLSLLSKKYLDFPIIFLEPSCYSMFAEDYKELHIHGADSIADRSILFEEFLEGLLNNDSAALQFKPAAAPVAIHGHCHAKALTDDRIQERLIRFIPQADPRTLETGCCGMAGSFGAMKEKYDLSIKLGNQLMKQVNTHPKNTKVVACGTSCRHQIQHVGKRTPLHIAEYLAQHIT
jgi:FAD/FMN-containing dehydrogenase/Fe-S oxidoreductase